MTVDEFDIQFDILYNNISSNIAPGLNAYEKSVFLSQAQKDIVIEMYNGRTIPGISFESTEEARSYLSHLVEERKLTLTLSTGFPEYEGCDVMNVKYPFEWVENEETLTENPLFIVNEYITYGGNADRPSKSAEVMPIKLDFLDKAVKNPFKCPNENRAFRINLDKKISILSKNIEDRTARYKVQYLKMPSPIILNGIEDSTLTIDGESCATSKECELHPILHSTILNRAVTLAKQAYIGSN